jgi:hypothetical protein
LGLCEAADTCQLLAQPRLILLVLVQGTGQADEAPSSFLAGTMDRHCDGLCSLKQLNMPAQPVDATLYLEGEMECGLMAHKFHRGFTAAEKTEWWDRWKRGESLKAIRRAFGKQSSSIYFLVAPHGGIRPAGRRRSRRH